MRPTSAQRADALQQRKFPRQAGFGHLAGAAGRRAADTEVVILKQNVKQHGAPILANGQQRGFKRRSGRHQWGRPAVIPGRGGKQRAELFNQRVAQNPPEHNQPAELGIPFGYLMYIHTQLPP